MTTRRTTSRSHGTRVRGHRSALALLLARLGMAPPSTVRRDGGSRYFAEITEVMVAFDVSRLLDRWIEDAAPPRGCHPSSSILPNQSLDHLRELQVTLHATIGRGAGELLNDERLTAAYMHLARNTVIEAQRLLDGHERHPGVYTAHLGPGVQPTMHQRPSIELTLPDELATRDGQFRVDAWSASTAELVSSLYVAGANVHMGLATAAAAYHLPSLIAEAPAQHRTGTRRVSEAMVAIHALACRAIELGVDWHQHVATGVQHASKLLEEAAPTLDHASACTTTIAAIDDILRGELAISRSPRAGTNNGHGKTAW